MPNQELSASTLAIVGPLCEHEEAGCGCPSSNALGQSDACRERFRDFQDWMVVFNSSHPRSRLPHQVLRQRLGY